MENIKLGDRVKVLGKNGKGEIAFIGPTHFADGTWLGIKLDEEKGRNNGAVDGRRYFKCPRNHGVFVRTCQIEKETVDNMHASEKINTTVSGKVTYPNYLKSGSKLKIDRQLCQSKCGEPQAGKNKSRMKNFESKTGGDFATLVSKKDQELHHIKEEITALKIKLKNCEESLQDALQNYTKATEEIKNLKDALEFKDKQISVQKCHLKFLKMRQCKHYKNANSFQTPNMDSNQTSHSTCIVSDSNLINANDDPNISDDEFDLESLKTLTSMQRIVELEEQNRIMIEGLVDLRHFLKQNCKLRYVDDSNTTNQNRSNSKSANSGSFLKTLMPLSRKLNELSFEESAAQMKGYGDILRQLTEFNEILKEKGISAQEFENSKVLRAPVSEDSTVLRKETFIDDKKIQSYKAPLKKSCSDIDNKTPIDICSFQKESEENSWPFNQTTNDFQTYYQSVGNLQFKQPTIATSKRKLKSQVHFAIPKTSSKVSDPVKELQQLMSTISSNADWARSSSLNSSAQQDLPVQQIQASASNSSFPNQLESPLALSDNTLNSCNQSSGINAFVKPTQKPKNRMMPSNEIRKLS